MIEHATCEHICGCGCHSAMVEWSLNLGEGCKQIIDGHFSGTTDAGGGELLMLGDQSLFLLKVPVCLFADLVSSFRRCLAARLPACLPAYLLIYHHLPAGPLSSLHSCTILKFAPVHLCILVLLNRYTGQDFVLYCVDAENSHRICCLIALFSSKSIAVVSTVHYFSLLL